MCRSRETGNEEPPSNEEDIMNSMHLIGRPATDVEVKEVNGGSKVSNFILAVDRTQKRRTSSGSKLGIRRQRPIGQITTYRQRTRARSPAGIRDRLAGKRTVVTGRPFHRVPLELSATPGAVLRT